MRLSGADTDVRENGEGGGVIAQSSTIVLREQVWLRHPRVAVRLREVRVIATASCATPLPNPPPQARRVADLERTALPILLLQ